VFERAAIGKVCSDAGRAKRVIADRRVDAGGDGAAAHHALGVRSIHGLIGGVVSAAGAE
jgi:hypothetical protein